MKEQKETKSKEETKEEQPEDNDKPMLINRKIVEQAMVKILKEQGRTIQKNRFIKKIFSDLWNIIDQ